MIRSTQQAEKLAVAGDVYALLATGADTDNTYSLIEARVPPGGGPPPHTQEDTELFYVIEGEVTFSVDGQQVTVGPGTHLRVTPGVLHAFRNNSDHTATMLIQTLPSGIENYFREVGQPVSSMTEHHPPTPADIEKLKTTAPRYGIQIKA